jgi:hypothetical protein
MHQSLEKIEAIQMQVSEITLKLNSNLGKKDTDPKGNGSEARS